MTMGKIGQIKNKAIQQRKNYDETTSDTINQHW